MMPNSFFRKLGAEEEQVFRQHTRETYTPGTTIPTIWHPASRAECELMNLEQNREIGVEEKRSDGE